MQTKTSKKSKGAPPKMEKLKRNKPLPLMVSEEEKEWYTRYAERKGWTVSNLVRTAVSEYMKNNPV